MAEIQGIQSRRGVIAEVKHFDAYNQETYRNTPADDDIVSTRTVDRARGRAPVTVSARVANTGTRAGAEVAQLYLGDPAAAGEPPRQLKGFRKVDLRPGQTATVRFTLTGHDLSYWSEAASRWVVPAGTFQVYLGDSSALASLPLRGSFSLGGR